jgi:UDP-N-acetylglucosamine--dolichyl-phosphate N-acetylglucosaminephosphotransferase
LNPASGKLEGQREHMNLVNLTLRVLGPKTEDQLCRILLWFQVLCCAGAFVVRYYVATFFYP